MSAPLCGLPFESLLRVPMKDPLSVKTQNYYQLGFLHVLFPCPLALVMSHVLSLLLLQTSEPGSIDFEPLDYSTKKVSRTQCEN